MIWGYISPLFFGCLWILAAAVVAMLPMRLQMKPGLALLIIAPFLLGWIGWVHGWIWVFAGTFAFVSMFRNPLRYFWRKWRGLETEVPK